VEVCQEELRATITASQEEIKNEETISKQVEGVLVFSDKWTKSLHKELSSKMQGERENRCQELGSKVQGTQLDIRTTMALKAHDRNSRQKWQKLMPKQGVEVAGTQ
jgi:hypothetical protein